MFCFRSFFIETLFLNFIHRYFIDQEFGFIVFFEFVFYSIILSSCSKSRVQKVNLGWPRFFFKICFQLIFFISSFYTVILISCYGSRVNLDWLKPSLFYLIYSFNWCLFFFVSSLNIKSIINWVSWLSPGQRFHGLQFHPP